MASTTSKRRMRRGNRSLIEITTKRQTSGWKVRRKLINGFPKQLYVLPSDHKTPERDFYIVEYTSTEMSKYTGMSGMLN